MNSRAEHRQHLIGAAAKWMATMPQSPQPIIPLLQKRFGLTALEASKAITEAHLIRARSY